MHVLVKAVEIRNLWIAVQMTSLCEVRTPRFRPAPVAAAVATVLVGLLQSVRVPPLLPAGLNASFEVHPHRQYACYKLDNGSLWLPILLYICFRKRGWL